MPTLVICEFIGGYLDGKIVRTDNESEVDILSASRIFRFTKGIVGKGIKGMSDAGIDAMINETYPGEAHDKGFDLTNRYMVTKSFVDESGAMSIRLEYTQG